MGLLTGKYSTSQNDEIFKNVCISRIRVFYSCKYVISRLYCNKFAINNHCQQTQSLGYA